MLESIDDIVSLVVILLIIGCFLVYFIRSLNVSRAKKLIKREKEYYKKRGDN